MIYTLKEEMRIIILLIIFGIYISSYCEFVYSLLKQLKNKIIKIITEIILWAIQILITYKFTYRMQDGYIPIYFLIFVILGIIIYILTKSLFYKEIKIFTKALVKASTKILKEIKSIVIPNYVKEIYKNYKKRRKNKKIKDIECYNENKIMQNDLHT